MKARKILILVPALLLALLLSGCLQTVVNLDIKEDLSADLDVKTGIDEDYYDMVGGESAFSNVDTGEEEGFTVTPYSADGYKGMETKGTIQDITKGNTMLDNMFGKNFLTVKEEDGKQIMVFKAPISGVQSQISGQSGYSISDLESFGKLDMRIIIKFPYTVTDSNATSVSGNTLTWDLVDFDETEMYAYVEGGGLFGGFGGGGFPVWLIIVIIAAAAAVAVFFILKYLKKKNAGGSQVNYAGYQTGTYMQQADGNAYQEPKHGPIYNAPEFGRQTEGTEAPVYRTDNETDEACGYTAPKTTAESAEEQSEIIQPEVVQPAEEQSEAIQPEIVQYAEEQPAAENVLKMAFCPQCGTKLPENGLFCPKCGCKLK